MKPRIALFGLPNSTVGLLHINVYANPEENSNGKEIFKSTNNDSGKIFDYVSDEINIGDTLTLVILSSGIEEYSYRFDFTGGDISHVPILTKETDINDKYVSKEWDLKLWNKWNPQKQHDEGVLIEKQYLMSRVISVAPVWESYYADSNIDYFEKFQKLWIGFNAYATHYSSETRDKWKILSLVKSNLGQEFHKIINNVSNQLSAEKWINLQKATGSDMTSDIVRDEISTTNSCLGFLEHAKSAIGVFSGLTKQLDGLVFLNHLEGKEVFLKISSNYGKYMGSQEGAVQKSNLANAFIEPLAPKSIIRVGSLVYHHPNFDSISGSLFSFEDYFGKDYSIDPYTGQTDLKLKEWEKLDPLFFRYLNILYQFRCAYFHGDLPPNRQNNELAKTAYHSLFELYPAIL